MSTTADTQLGRVILLPTPPLYALWMDCCGDWERMDERQFRGDVSVNHAAVCRAGGTYHETHDFSAAVDDAGGWKRAKG